MATTNSATPIPASAKDGSGNGVSPLGKQVIGEMNRLGIMVDVSHASKDSMLQTAALSKAPIIASHSAARVLCNVSRNLDDEQLLALKESGGVIQIVAYNGFIKTTEPDTAERKAALTDARNEYNLPDPNSDQPTRAGASRIERITVLATRRIRRESRRDRSKIPGDPPATVKDLVDHIDYAVKLIGIDHVGISSDFDGGGGVSGWNDAGETFNVTLELVRRGYTEQKSKNSGAAIYCG